MLEVMRGVLLALAFGACGGFAAAAVGACGEDYAAEGSAYDAGAEEARIPDDAPAACDVSKPFADPTEVALGTGDLRSPSLTPDELTIHFVRDNRLHVATRASLSAPFSASIEMPNVNVAAVGFSPRLTRDGKTLYLAQATPYGPAMAVAYRTTQGPFGAPAFVKAPGMNAFVGYDPTLAADDTLLYYTTIVPTDGGALLRISRAAFVTPGEIGTASDVTELSSSADDSTPVLTPGETTIYFASRRPGGAGDFDIWTSSRSAPNATWGTPTRAAELSSTAAERPGWISDDGCRLYMSRGTGTSRILMAARPR
jgi:WD40-like Beta Propeller Repeat